MRFGIKDICIVSFIGLLTGRYIIKIIKSILDSIPFINYLVGAIGLIAAVFIILMVRPLIKQESSD
jgi:xanthosine utilization system XapX-like protein